MTEIGKEHFQTRVHTSPRTSLADISKRHRNPLHFGRSLIVKDENMEAARKIEKGLGFTKLAARLLASKGFEPGDALDAYLEPSMKEFYRLYSQRPVQSLRDSILRIIEKGEKTALWCDYDVDGLSGAAQLKLLFEKAGVETQTFVPHRIREGYGLNVRMVEAAASCGCRCAIAIDIGSQDIEVLARAQELGIRTLVIDHHYLEEEPKGAFEIFNPHLLGEIPELGLMCASGLCCLACLAVSEKLPEQEQVPRPAFLQLAALGTVCDVMPLQGVNRVIVRFGFEALRTDPLIGLGELLHVSGLGDPKKEISTFHAGFDIGPRINAAGRMNDALVAFDLLSTKDLGEGRRLAEQISNFNMTRQNLELEILSIIESYYKADDFKDGIFVLIDQEKIPDEEKRCSVIGVMGIIASRLVEAYGRPAVVLVEDNNEILKGSLRTIEGVSIIEILGECGESLTGFGGHEAAGGCSLISSKSDDFKEAFLSACRRRHLSELSLPPLCVDAVISPRDFDHECAEELDLMKPFGTGNTEPIVILKGAVVSNLKALKGGHLKVRFVDPGQDFSAIYWNHEADPLIEEGSVVDILGTLRTISYSDRRQIELEILAVAESL